MWMVLWPADKEKMALIIIILRTYWKLSPLFREYKTFELCVRFKYTSTHKIAEAPDLTGSEGKTEGREGSTRLWISWFPRLRFCGRCKNLEFTITITWSIIGLIEEEEGSCIAESAGVTEDAGSSEITRSTWMREMAGNCRYVSLFCYRLCSWNSTRHCRPRLVPVRSSL